MSDYVVNVMQIAKIVTKNQGTFFVRMHDGFKVNEIIRKAEYICDIERIHYEHIEIIEPSEEVLAGFMYDEVWCGTGDVVIKYRNKKVVSVERLPE